MRELRVPLCFARRESWPERQPILRNLGFRFPGAGDSRKREFHLFSAGALIGAIASGRKCAVIVDRFLGGSGIIDEALAPAAEAAEADH